MLFGIPGVHQGLQFVLQKFFFLFSFFYYPIFRYFRKSLLKHLVYWSSMCCLPDLKKLCPHRKCRDRYFVYAVSSALTSAFRLGEMELQYFLTSHLRCRSCRSSDVCNWSDTDCRPQVFTSPSWWHLRTLLISVWTWSCCSIIGQRFINVAYLTVAIEK